MVIMNARMHSNFFLNFLIQISYEGPNVTKKNFYPESRRVVHGVVHGVRVIVFNIRPHYLSRNMPIEIL